MSEREWHVYVLLDPRTLEPRYVGWSLTPRKRLRAHINSTKRGVRGHKAHWIAELLRIGREPFMVIVCSGHGSAEFEERRWIRELREAGHSLTNATDGGDGAPGLIASDETRRRMSAAHKGRKMPPEATAKTAAALRGRKQSAAHVAALSAVRRGKAPMKACAAAALAIRGTKQSLEHIRKRIAPLVGRVRPESRRLDDESVRVIRSGCSTEREHAERFGIAVATVHGIRTKRLYADVTDWNPVDLLRMFPEASSNDNRELERIWFSPNCLPIETQRSLFT